VLHFWTANSGEISDRKIAACTRVRLALSIAAWLLEAGAPVTLLGAQALFVARPFLGPQSEALAHLLEEDDEVHAFAAYLREGVVT